mmetsp:Transcript_36367/g.79174  ORF Transcript_36367/g.79174 Transcript_36367/m.79174 type:complete len:422 (-) Transcript_36367:82-1347(-)
MRKPNNTIEAWPVDAEGDYVRMRAIGNGAYGKVWAARRRKLQKCGTCTTRSNDNGDGCERCHSCSNANLVAMKIIATSGKNGKAYAEREISILGEMNHPNIVRLVRSYNEYSGGRLVVLSLARGPTLKEIVDEGGALSLPLARLVSRHLVAAISYLHSRAVLHRDLKPENCVLDMQGYDSDWKHGGIMWNDDEYGKGHAEDIINRECWKVVLVDLGFARSLSVGELRPENDANAAAAETVDEPQAFHYGDNENSHEIGQSFASRVLLRSMSALGSKAYAAPELTRIRKKTEEDTALTEYVSDYTFLADEFALGKTLREVMTGVPAGERDINEFVKLERLSSYFGGGKRKQYRLLSEIPKDASELLRDLLRPNARERITCWVAQLYPWICGGTAEELYRLPRGDVPSCPGDSVVVLDCMQPI